MNDSQKMKWYTLAFMCFSTLWGFGNVLNGFMYFNGIQVIFSWIFDVCVVLRSLGINGMVTWILHSKFRWRCKFLDSRNNRS